MESRAAWAQPLPPCPLHASRHPLDVRYDDGGAWWWCAHDGARVRDLPAVDELRFWAG